MIECIVKENIYIHILKMKNRWRRGRNNEEVKKKKKKRTKVKRKD